jgi:hypothetical protein
VEEGFERISEYPSVEFFSIYSRQKVGGCVGSVRERGRVTGSLGVDETPIPLGT